MTFIDEARTQTATLWVPGSVDISGDATFAAPATLTVRWEDKEEVFTTPDGEEQRASTVVFAGQDISVGSYLFLGTSVAADPKTVSGARKVRGFKKIPSIDGTLFERKAML